jgi:putative Holliday junction resolvase
MQANRNSILALDVGGRRIGVAAADIGTRLPHPLTTIEVTDSVYEDLQELVLVQGAIGLVIGLPRGLEGQETAQTKTVRVFAKTLGDYIKLPLYWQDEALTSQKAELELDQRGKPYKKGDIDALSATYILEDFLHDHPEVTG